MHDPERFDELVQPHAKALEALVEVHQATIEQRQLTPSASAPMLGQIAGQQRWGVPGIATNPVDQVISIGAQYSVAACDHLRAICTLVTTPQGVMFADKVLLRSGLEALARAAWLFHLGPNVDARERARRGVNERLHQMCRNIFAIERNTALRRSHPHVNERLQRMIERRDVLMHGAVEAGLGELSGPDKWGHYRIGAARPTATAALQFLLNRGDGVLTEEDADLGGIVQSAYSEFVHTNLTAIRHQAMIDEVDEPGTGDLQTVPFGTSAGDVMFTVELAAGGLISATEDIRTAMGWTDDAEWQRILLDALAVLKVDGALASAPLRPRP